MWSDFWGLKMFATVSCAGIYGILAASTARRQTYNSEHGTYIALMNCLASLLCSTNNIEDSEGVYSHSYSLSFFLSFFFPSWFLILPPLVDWKNCVTVGLLSEQRKKFEWSQREFLIKGCDDLVMKWWDVMKARWLSVQC